MADLKKTPLHDLHVRLGAKMVPFAGYDMPVQYADGVLKEHNWTREKAGLFDVSHMGQAWLATKETPIGAADAHQKVSDAIESLTPGEIRKLNTGALRYTLLLNDEGGIIDDLMVTRMPRTEDDGRLFLVVNAACKENDFAVIERRIGDRVKLHVAADRALLALQGSKAAAVVEGLFPGAAQQKFMTMMGAKFEGEPVIVSRCGYTGEDGFEISVLNKQAEALAEKLLAHPDVAPIGLGARDSLRLESGLCLYGHDIDETTSPVEGNVAFAIGKRRREEGGFPGADRILRELKDGTSRLRVGLRPEGRAPAREGAEIESVSGGKIGVVTSGGFGPTLGGPLAMGYVDAAHAAKGTKVNIIVRGKPLAAEVVDMPFVPQNYYRG